MEKHVHGGRIFGAAADLNLSLSEIADFSANINPLGQPEGLRERLFDAFETTIHYPETDAASFARAAAESAGLPEGAVLPGAGSTPHIRMLARILSPGKFAVVGPAFAEYEESLLAAGNPPERVFAKEEKDFLVDREVAAEALEKRPAAVIVANPANPTGRLVPDETLDYLIERSEKDGFALIVDEAFIDFTKGRSLEKKVLTNPKLLILRSLTKIHAIPGLRLAYLAGHPETVGGFKAIQEPWPINGMALEAGLHCLRGAEARGRETRAAVEKLKERLVGILSPLGRLFPSDANFVLFKTGGKEARELLAGLYREGILVRDASNFKGLGEGFLRFAVRPEPELARLEEALGDLRARTS